MRKSALVVGCDGQDGRIAVKLLDEKGYHVLGISKTPEKTSSPRGFKRVAVDITSFNEVSRLIKKERPEEIYYLAAFHHSSQDKKIDNISLLTKSFRVNVLSLLNFLEAVRLFSPSSKLFYASSSLIFGEAKAAAQNEETKFNPETIYGITKADGIFLCRMYRKQYGVFAATGILYNHESTFRKEKFLSQKIVTTALRIKKGKSKSLVLGDLKAEVDWGYAPDYVRAMYKILQLEEPDDFVIATGKKHSVLYFAQTVFNMLGLDWKKYVKEESEILTRKRASLVGDARKLRASTGWEPKTSFEEMVKILINAKNSNSHSLL